MRSILTAMMERHLLVLGWLQENRKLGLFLSLFACSFVLLLVVYLLLANLRMHVHIRRLNRDKSRLMEEKDLMRRGLQAAAGEAKKAP